MEKATTDRKPFFINLSLCLLAIGIFFVFLEIAARFSKSDFPVTPGTYVSHPSRRYKLRPNFSGRTYGHRYKINSSGLRDHEYALTKGRNTFRILSVGDSCTFGIGLDLNDTYPKQLEEALQDKYPNLKIEAINCGVPSYNTVNEYLFLTEEGIHYNPDLIIIAYVYNDSVYNYPITPSKYRLVNGFKDFLRRFYSYEFLLDKIYKAAYILKGLAANDPGIRRENLEYVYSDKYIGWLENKKAFSLLHEFSSANNIPLLYVIYPKFESFEHDYPYLFYHRIIAEALHGEHYVLDLLPYFVGTKTKELWVTGYDSHPNKQANAIISKAVSDFIAGKFEIDKPAL